MALLAKAAGACAQTPSSSWYDHAVIYEIYPRSFQDSNGDGVGDLKSITQRLDYLQNLGVDAIWLTPFFPSPNLDFGYDISNYTDVAPEYGAMADWDELVRQAKQRNIRVLIDFVVNHTSDQHPWFQKSRSSTTNTGFTDSAPWLPIETEAAAYNVAVEQAHNDSILNWYAQLLKLCRTPVFAQGAYRPLVSGNAKVFAFARELHAGGAVIVLNMSANSEPVALAGLSARKFREMVIANPPAPIPHGDRFTVPPFATMVVSY